MVVAIVTGAGGLVGSEAVDFLADRGMDIVGVDNDMRRYFFGDEASTKWRIAELVSAHERFQHRAIDIRDFEAVQSVFGEFGSSISLVLHAAAQPSHDWAAHEPSTDFFVNAVGTLNMLEATRKYAPSAVFIFLSTNKVYGDTPNQLPLIEKDTRWEIEPSHRWASDGIDETMTIDQSTHSLFGASKTSADLLVQEYGRNFGLSTACFRGGCLTGGGHSGTELHGFLAYLMKCTMIGRPYTIFGYRGKQVRDNIHSRDLIEAVWRFYESPRSGAVYNIGGGRFADCSILEAITLCEEIAGRNLHFTYSEQNRSGDHIWWISDISRFKSDFPDFSLQRNLRDILEDIHENGKLRWR